MQTVAKEVESSHEFLTQPAAGIEKPSCREDAGCLQAVGVGFASKVDSVMLPLPLKLQIWSQSTRQDDRASCNDS